MNRENTLEPARLARLDPRLLALWDPLGVPDGLFGFSLGDSGGGVGDAAGAGAGAGDASSFFLVFFFFSLSA